MRRLEIYRERIDEIDRNIVKLLIMRFTLVKKIRDYKKWNKISITDKKREQKVINNAKKHSNKENIYFIGQFFKKIINYSKKLER